MGRENADAAEAVAAVSSRRTDLAAAENGDDRALPPDETEGAPNAWPDESTEAAMLSELRASGETAMPVAVEAVREIDPKDMPPLDALVKRLPPDVREALDDLFRVKFVRVVRVPQKALKP